MRIPLTCMQCFKKYGQPDDAVYSAELQDDGLYWMKCRNGHETVTCLQEQKFEVLYDLAANAIIDGYCREAVVSFTSSLERFFEFYIKVISVKRNVSEEKFIEAWKKISSQSERQLGAYVFLYTIENNQPPPLLDNNRTNFRNEVIHKGKIPTKEQAIEYGQAVLDIVEPILADLKTNNSKYINQVVSRHVRDLRRKIEGNNHISFMSVPTTISISRTATEPQPRLEDTLMKLVKRRAKSGW